MIHPRAIVITVTKAIVPGQPLLGDLTRSFNEASKKWSGDLVPSYLLIRVDGQSGILAWEMNQAPCDLEAMTAWAETTSGTGRAEILGYFDPLRPAQKAQRSRIERKKVVSNGPIDRSMKPERVVPSLRPLLEPEGRRECDNLWGFLMNFVEKTPLATKAQRMEEFIRAMPDNYPRLLAADRALKGILTESLRAICRGPHYAVAKVLGAWPGELRDGCPDFPVLKKKAQELIDFRPPARARPAKNADDDVDAEWAALKYF